MVEKYLVDKGMVALLQNKKLKQILPISLQTEFRQWDFRNFNRQLGAIYDIVLLLALKTM